MPTGLPLIITTGAAAPGPMGLQIAIVPIRVAPHACRACIETHYNRHCVVRTVWIANVQLVLADDEMSDESVRSVVLMAWKRWRKAHHPDLQSLSIQAAYFFFVARSDEGGMRLDPRLVDVKRDEVVHWLLQEGEIEE